MCVSKLLHPTGMHTQTLAGKVQRLGIKEGKSLYACFSPEMGELYLKRISIMDVAVHVLVALWLGLFVAAFFLSIKHENYYSTGVGMCLGR